jgi:hypothetical protein
MRALLLAALLGLAATPAGADDKPRPPPDPVYKAECGSCHVAYPPKLLPAASWQQLMQRLDRHFGSDASLDAKAQEEISRYLAANAGRRDSPAGVEPRITETSWFRKEHDKEVPAALWKSAAVKSAANCGACHTRADDGDYSERALRLPR